MAMEHAQNFSQATSKNCQMHTNGYTNPPKNICWQLPGDLIIINVNAVSDLSQNREAKTVISEIIIGNFLLKKP